MSTLVLRFRLHVTSLFNNRISDITKNNNTFKYTPTTKHTKPMKKLLGIMAITALAASAFAQGTVTLVTKLGSVKQWTSSSDSTLISVPKSGGYIQLIAAPKGHCPANPLFTSCGGWRTANYSSLAGFLAANPGWAASIGPNTGATANPALIAAAAGSSMVARIPLTGIGAGREC